MPARHWLAAASWILACCPVLVAWAPPVRAADPAPAPPQAAEFQPAAIRVPNGFEVELAAGPPLVLHPMMACLDDRGRLYIAESAGLNLKAAELEQELPNFIRMLEDTDGDGRYDKSTIFADKMTLPQGALWHQGSLYVASPPNIWRLRDTDGDGVADQRQVLVDKFGYTGNAASVHGCFLHPNGRIYWCDGRHGHEFRSDDGRLLSRGEGSYIFSCNPDGSDVRAHCGGGMDNPVEVDFTDAGDVLGTVNILYTGPRLDCLVHWLHGGTYPHSERVLGEFKRTGDLLGPVHKFGHVAVSGTTRYRSGALDQNWRDDFFVTIFNTGKLQRLELRPAGSTFQATEHEFLTCDSPDFHPTDVLEDADGSLLLIDTGGWFRIGCPTSQIAKPEVQGGIYRIRRAGMPAASDPWGQRIAWDELTAERLVELLNDPRFKVRERAITACAQRGESLVPALAAAVRADDLRQRLGAVWALTRIGSPAARAAVRIALDDPESSVRQAACQSVATTRDRDAGQRLADMLVLREDNPAVRRVAAEALGRIGDPQAVTWLLRTLERGPARPLDRSEEHAVIYALIEIGDPRGTAEGLTYAEPAIRRGALIALQQMDARLEPEAVLTLLESNDDSAAAAALEVFVLHPEWSQHAARLLQQWLTSPSLSDRQRGQARRLATAFLTQPPVATLVGELLAAETTSLDARRTLLGSLADSKSIPLHDTWTAGLHKLLATDDPLLLDDALAAVAAIKTERFSGTLQQLAADTARPPLVRVAALEAIGHGSSELSGEAFQLLLELLASRAAPGQAGRAAALLGNSALNPDQLQRLAPRLAQAGPLELRSLIKPYAGNQDPATGREFLTAVERSPGMYGLSVDELAAVVQRFPPDVRPLAEPLLEKLRAKDQQRQQRLAELESYLERGDAERGRALFALESTKCNTCHRVGEDGGRIGPDLTTIGRIRSSRDLLEAIVFPSASLAREYEAFNVITTSGQVLSGLVVGQSSQAVHLQPQAGPPVVLARDEIEEIVPSPVSLMPEGLDRTLPPDQVADLIAYLRSLR